MGRKRAVVPVASVMVMALAGTSAIAAPTSHKPTRLTDSVRFSGHPLAGQRATILPAASTPSGDHVTGYALTFGDHSRGSKGRSVPRSLTHVFAKAGTYTVTLTVTDSHRRAAHAVARIRIGARALGSGGATTGTVVVTPTPTSSAVAPSPSPTAQPTRTASPTSSPSGTPTGTAAASKVYGPITEYTGAAVGNPSSLTVGPDGALWFIDSAGGALNSIGYPTGSIGRISTSGVVTDYSGTGIDGASAITAGSDGALWFISGNTIGRLTTAGKVTSFPDSRLDGPTAITAGSDGALWFINGDGGGGFTIGRISTAGTFSFFSHSGLSLPEHLTSGPDGALWFANYGGVPDSIYRVTTSGQFTGYANPAAPGQPWTGAEPWDIASGPDGALWFTMSCGNSACPLGRITTSGAVSYTAGLDTNNILTAGSGALWATIGVGPGTQIGRVTTAGALTATYTDPTISTIRDLVSGPDGAIWFTNTGGLHETGSIGRLAP